MGATHHHGQTLANLLRQAELGAPPREDVDGVGGLLGAEAAQGGRHGGVRGQLQLCFDDQVDIWKTRGTLEIFIAFT